jgi:arginyl-tRNA synthetase
MEKFKSQIGQAIASILKVEVNEADFTAVPKANMGDLALPCFDLAKQLKTTPVDVATRISEELTERIAKFDFLVKVESAGPYVNFYFDDAVLVKYLLKNVLDDKTFGQGEKKKKKIMIEFAHPNTHKMFHIGHLRNIITGESLVRIMENAGYKVVRANYQGDVGMHIAKALWGIKGLQTEYEAVKSESLQARVAFLGKAYALGSKAFETDAKAKDQILDYNEAIYTQEKSIKEIYKTTRKWSLEYFDNIYERVGSKFDRFYFESEVYKRGKQIVEDFKAKDIFKDSEGAVIFEGEKQGLHNRVFINSKGFPTYEAKDLALAELQFKEYKPERIIHVVGKEQIEYFKVVFRAEEYTLPTSRGKQEHLAYGWVSLKSGKMSSRTGQVVLGEWLLDEVEKMIGEIMENTELEDKQEVLEKVAVAAVKYAMLKVGVTVDMSFDLNESISLSGDSGPYLLYIGARINSILDKAGKINISPNYEKLDETEKSLILKLMTYPEVANTASETMDPSKIAKYLFDLAQLFNNFYAQCPVLQAEDRERDFRLNLIVGVQSVMKKGLNLLGIETVQKM